MVPLWIAAENVRLMGNIRYERGDGITLASKGTRR